MNERTIKLIKGFSLNFVSKIAIMQTFYVPIMLINTIWWITISSIIISVIIGLLGLIYCWKSMDIIDEA